MTSFFRHKTLRLKAGIYFAFGFTVLWMICNTFLYMEFRRTLWENFDSQMRNEATLIANRTSINPRLVPLPEDGENFLITYTDFYETIDTLFLPSPELLSRLSAERNVRVEAETEEGTLTIRYSMSANKVHETIRKITGIFAVAFILGIILAMLSGYRLSGKLIRPVKRIIKLADITDLQNNTQLLDEPEPETEDELKQLTSSFNRMLTRIKEQSDLQNTFFASASHELRTPLSIMLTRLQVLLTDEQLSTNTKQVFEEQLAEVKRMISMVNTFLLMSELQKDNRETIKTACNLSDILTTVISQHKQKSIERGLSFKISFIPVDESFSVMADEEKLFIILNNLIINSLKYSRENGVIDILLDKTDTQNMTFRIRNKIREGMSPDISTVKKSFYHSKPLHVEGSGLGLWIANRLSEANEFTMTISISGDLFEVTLRNMRTATTT